MSIIITIIVGFFIYFSLSNRLDVLEKDIRKIKKDFYQQVPESSTVSKEISQIPVSPESVQNDVVRPTNIENNTVSRPVTEVSAGKLLAVVGIISVFLGVSFFLKFAFDNNLITIFGRIMMGYAAGVLVVILGISLRKRYREYADKLTGGGIAILYLTTYASYAFYHLTSDITAYVVLIVLTFVAVMISMALETENLAILGFIGAYLTPLVVALHTADTFTLFGYLLVVNLGIASVAYWHKWTNFRLVGVIGSIIISYAWYTGSIEHFTSDNVLVFSFASVYFLVFLISGMLHHVVRKEISNEVDALALTLNGLLYAGFGYILLNPTCHDQMGLFMVLVAMIHFVAAIISYGTNKEDTLMNLVLPALGVIFLTIAIPIEFKGSVIPVLWISEAFLLFLVEYNVQGKNMYIYGLIVYIVGLLNLFTFHLYLETPLSNFDPIFNSRFMLFAFATLAGYSMAYIASLDSRRRSLETAKSAKVFMAIVSQIVGLIAITLETGTYFDKQALLSGGADLENMKNTAISIVWTLYATLLTAIGFAGRHKTIRIGGLVLFFVTAFKIFIDLWALGLLYRVVASVVFGVVALTASFAYTKFKSRLFSE